MPPDLTQEGHLEGLPIGTRGGAIMRYTFPRTGEYEVQIRLTRDRDEHVEGLSEPHDLELLLDRERVQLFTVTPPQGEAIHATVDQHLKIRVPVQAGAHTRRRRIPEEAVAAPGKRAPAVPGTLQLLPASADPAGDLFGVDHRALRRRQRRRYAQPPAALRIDAGWSGSGRALGQADSRHAHATGLPSSGHRRGPPAAARAVSGRTERGGLRRRHRNGAVRGAGEPALPLPRRAGARRRSRENALSRQRPGPGVAAVLLPVEQYSGRRAADRGGGRHAPRAGGAGAAGAPHAGGRARAGTGHQLRRRSGCT